jgi:hypothetical protein
LDLFLALLLFQSEFTSQQLPRVVGYLPQPLFQGLAAFAIQAWLGIGELFFAAGVVLFTGLWLGFARLFAWLRLRLLRFGLLVCGCWRGRRLLLGFAI